MLHASYNSVMQLVCDNLISYHPEEQQKHSRNIKNAD